MSRHRWWHWVRWHQIRRVPYDPRLPLDYTKVRERCSCGDEWVFSALGNYEAHVPAAQS
jgi:hypothetical protein